MVIYTNIHYSLVATTFNDGKHILQYLNNIMEQVYLPSEIVIADGGSNDNTVKLINEFAKLNKIPIIILSGSRLNISEGYNTAIKACTCPIIAMTGIGNWYHKEYFKLLCEEMAATDNDIVYSPIRGQNSTRFSTLYNNAFLNGGQGQILSFATNHGALVKKKVFEELNFFYERFIYAGEDTEFFTLALKKGYKTSCVKSAIVCWETPTTFKQFLKQIKNYIIGNMQIYSKKKLLYMYRAQIRKICLLLLAMIIIIVNISNWIPIIIITFFAFYWLLKKIKYGKKSLCLKFIMDYIPIYYLLRNRKYLSDNYQVKREDL